MVTNSELAAAAIAKLQAALSIARVIDMTDNGGALHGVVDDGNVTGDLTFDQDQVNQIRAAGFRDGDWQMTPEQVQVYQDCLDALRRLPDDEREEALELFECAYRCEYVHR